jgi:DNA-directed RNA polymerase subunit RPC12/RpoP
MSDLAQKIIHYTTIKGRTTIGDVCDRFKVPTKQFKDFILELWEKGEWSGALDWKNGLILPPKALETLPKCPQCGREINKTSNAENFIECGYCGIKIYPNLAKEYP